jgi:hypothetical protein
MNPNMAQVVIDAVPELSRKHFEEALRTARTSVTRSVTLIKNRIWRNSSNSEGNSTLLTLPDRAGDREESKLTGPPGEVRPSSKTLRIMLWNRTMTYTVDSYNN